MNIHGRHSNFSLWSLERNHQKLKWVKTNGWSIVSRYVTVFEEKFKFYTDLSDLFLKDEASGRLQASDQLIPNLSKLTLLPYDAQMSKLAGEALIRAATSIAQSKLIALPQNRGKDQQLAEFFKYSVHPHVWGMGNPEVLLEGAVGYIDELDVEWPAKFGKAVKKGVFGTAQFPWLPLLHFLREPDTYGKSGTNDWIATQQEYKKARERVENLLKSKKNHHPHTRHKILTRNRLELAKAETASDSAKARLMEYMRNGLHLFITTPKLFRQACVNGWTLNATEPGRSNESCVICVPFGRGDDAENSEDTENGPDSGEKYDDWIGFVRYFAVFNIKNSTSSILSNQDPTCSCPQRCTSIANLDPDSSRRSSAKLQFI